MNTSTNAMCPKCGAALRPQTKDPSTLRGLCSKCLALVAFGSEADNDPTIMSLANEPGSAAAESALASRVRYFGDYELEDEIGRGGMGVVYRAKQISLNRTVAVKMILAGPFAGSAQRQRFQNEAEAAAHLRHPNIVAIHEVGEHEGRGYFSMDYIDGRSLADVLRDGRMNAVEAATMVKTLADAVHYAHQRGTLHRDLKPHNVLVSADGVPHILDFGLARQIDGDTDLTRTGDVMGSPNYMPPEQAQGQLSELGPPTDVYALGAILYEALAGRTPFKGETVAEVLRQVIEQDPAPPTRWNPNIPSDLETICLKCLEKRPERRYHSARALSDDLQRFLNVEPILAKPAGSVRKTWSWFQQNPWSFAAACGLMVLVLACVAYGFWEKSRHLAWQLRAAKDSTRPVSESPALLFLKLLPGVCYLLYFAGKSFRKVHRGRLEGRTHVSDKSLIRYAGIGAAGTAFGVGYLLLQIRHWAWLESVSYLLSVELVGILAALPLIWMGFRMVWEGVGMHDTSRFRGIVDQSLAREVASEARRWSLLKLIGFALWLPFAVGTAAVCVLLWAFKSTNQEFLGGIVGILLSVGFSLWTHRVFRERRRLLTNVFLPFLLILSLCAIAAISWNLELVSNLLGYSFMSVLVFAPGLLIFTRLSKGSLSSQGRFPVNPWLDAVWGVVTGALILAIFHGVENWRGRRALNLAVADLARAGETLNLGGTKVSEVPDTDNTMAQPYMRRYFVGAPFPRRNREEFPPTQIIRSLSDQTLTMSVLRSQDRASLQRILDAYAPCQPDFDLLEAALAKLFCELRSPERDLLAMPIPNFVSFRTAAEAYALLARVHLVIGEPDKALKNLETLWKLRQAVQCNRPLPLVAAMAHVAISGLAMQVIEETLAMELWPQVFIPSLQKLCGDANVLHSVSFSLRQGERAALVEFLQDRFEKIGWAAFYSLNQVEKMSWIDRHSPMNWIRPRGWLDQNCANHVRLTHLAWAGLDPAGARIDARAIDDGQERALHEMATSSFQPVYVFSTVVFPDMKKALRTAARHQTAMDQGYLACALRRHRASRGQFPETLEELVPAFASRIPTDLFDGKPLRYQRLAPDRFRLYSIGWNSRDDGGEPEKETASSNRWKADQGDWVWGSAAASGN